MKYDAEVTRDGRWWMISVPAIDALTQARHVAEIPLMARELVAVHQGEKLEDVEVSVRYRDINGVSGERVAGLEKRRRLAAALTRAVGVQTSVLVRELVAAKVPLREVAELIGVSYQRVHQLTADPEVVPSEEVNEAEVVDLVAALRRSIDAAVERRSELDRSA